MEKHTSERFQVFEAATAKLADVLECYLITGQAADYMLKVVLRDMPDYERLLLGKFTPVKGVSGVQSSCELCKVVNKTALPLPKV